MPIVLPHGLESHEIRILQEYRRLNNAESLPLSTLSAVRHPAGASDAAVRSLVAKGFLTGDASGENFTVTGKAREFLAIEAKPEFEEPPKKAGGTVEAEAEPAP